MAYKADHSTGDRTPVGPKGPTGQTGSGGNKDQSNPYDSRLKNQRYQRKKTKAYEATLDRMLKVGGTILGGALGPFGAAANAVTQAAMGVDPMNPFGEASGTTDTFSYDPKNTAQTAEKVEEDKKLAPQKPKKKKPIMKGFTLLEGAGGTLLGL